MEHLVLDIIELFTMPRMPPRLCPVWRHDYREVTGVLKVGVSMLLESQSSSET